MLLYKGYTKGRLTVLEFSSTKLPSGSYRRCQCLCGKVRLVKESNFRRDYPTCTECNTKQEHPLTYKTFDSMIQRCTNPNSPDYPNYGGRGITIDPMWKKDFYYFLRDMGERPSESMTLDRIDLHGNYTKDNCRWADKTVQANNRRKLNRTFVKGKWQVYVTIAGKSTYIGRFSTEQEADRAVEKYTELRESFK